MLTETASIFTLSRISFCIDRLLARLYRLPHRIQAVAEQLLTVAGFPAEAVKSNKKSPSNDGDFLFRKLSRTKLTAKAGAKDKLKESFCLES